LRSHATTPTEKTDLVCRSFAVSMTAARADIDIANSRIEHSSHRFACAAVKERSNERDGPYRHPGAA
jgi:hypothetical protein